MKTTKTAAILLAATIFIQITTAVAQPALTLQDVWASRKFVNNSVYGVNPTADGKHYTSLVETTDGNQAVVKYNFGTGKATDTLYNTRPATAKNTEKITEKITVDAYQLSPNEKQIIVATNTQQIYRHSTTATNYIYDLSTKTLRPLATEGLQMHATFAPDGNAVAFVRNRNLFVIDLKNGFKETQLTYDTNKNFINGSSDWVYEEEFVVVRAFEWSPSSTHIAYYRFDETEVPQFEMPIYAANLYPENETFKYPKAGENNSIVEIYVCNLQTKKSNKIDVGNDPTQYIPRIGFTKDENTMWVQRMNRLQNKLEILYANLYTGTTTPIYTEQNDTWIDIGDELTFLSNGNFVFGSEKSGYKHLYLYDAAGKQLNAITQGKYEITDFYGVNEKTNTVYYASTEINSIEKHIYCSKLDGSNKQQLSHEKGTNNAQFSRDYSYFLNFHNAAGAPNTVTVCDAAGKTIRTIEDNKETKKNVKTYNFATVEMLQVPAADGTPLNAWMIKPKNFDKNKKYPVLMYVYGGPGSQTTADAWGGGNYVWFQYLAQQGYIVASVDGRGTGFKGENFKKCTYKQLGNLETQDQIAAAQYLGKQTYIDAQRIGIFGWSYGGYMSSLCITKGADVFKTAIAVAPVINWRWYDSIYTERYMQTPQDNASGYDDNSPINHVEKLKGNYLLIHGTADDNVHFQNSAMMVKKMVEQNKTFDFEMYPDKNHGIYGGKTRLQLFSKMTDYILKNL
jgi:dipeptidyl-peptidase-4